LEVLRYGKLIENWGVGFVHSEGTEFVKGDVVDVKKVNGDMKQVTIVRLIGETYDEAGVIESWYSFTRNEA